MQVDAAGLGSIALLVECSMIARGGSKAMRISEEQQAHCQVLQGISKRAAALVTTLQAMPDVAAAAGETHQVAVGEKRQWQQHSAVAVAVGRAKHLHTCNSISLAVNESLKWAQTILSVADQPDKRLFLGGEGDSASVYQGHSLTCWLTGSHCHFHSVTLALTFSISG